MLAMWKYQQSTGIKLTEFAEVFPDKKEVEKGNLGRFNEDVSLLFKLIWAGLYKEDDLATPEQVAQILDFEMITEVAMRVLTHAVETMPDEEETEKKVTEMVEKKKNSSGTGPSSEKQPVESE